ncbi:MAG: T9SS type A sorting domain-containing protein [Saprospiraceae bacterium]
MKFFCYNLIFLLCPLMTFGQWNQLGSAIQGESDGDKYGYSTSINASGNVMIAGAYENSDNGYFAGHAQVFEWDGGNWIQRGEDIDGNLEEWSGHEVDIDGSGNRVAVGAIQGVNSAGVSSGIVRVFDWDGTNWNQTGSTIEGLGSGLGSDWFGSALSFSADGNTLAIGAPLNNSNGGLAGQVRIYKWDGTDWVQLGDDILGDEAHDQFGGNVSLNDEGNMFAAGARGAGDSGFGTNFTGHVYVYEWDGSDWIKRGSQLLGDISGDDFGRSVSLNGSGDILAVGAPGYNVVSGNLECTTHIYEWDGNDWLQRGSTLTGVADIDLFGWSVSLNSNGNILAVGGAPFFSNGSVWIFEWTGTTWEQQGDELMGENSNDFFGSSVSINDIGNTLAVGAWGNQDIGHVRVFENLSIVSTQDINTINLNYFPNPTSDYLHVSASTNIESIIVYDISGKEMMTRQGTNKEMRLELDKLKEGTYFLEIRSQNQKRTVKFIKV